MAVMGAQYKHPNSAYSQGLKNLIDSMLKVNPNDRPDIHEVRKHPSFALRITYSTGAQVIRMTDQVLQSLR